MELKIGDVVYLNSNPKVKMTVAYIEQGSFQGLYFNEVSNKFEYTVKIPFQAVTRV